MICASGIRNCRGKKLPARAITSLRTLQKERSGFRQKAAFSNFQRFAALCRDAATTDYEVIWGVLDVEAAKLKASVLAILAKEFPEPPASQTN
jgi:hypothetical protein